MKTTGKLFIGILALLSLSISSASAQNYLEDFTTNQSILFEFGAYAGNNAFVPDGVQVTVPASADSFGGLGVAPFSAPMPPAGPVDLAALTAIEITARLDAGNASDIVLSIREANDAAGNTGEFFSFTISQSNFTMGSFTTFSFDPATFGGFNGDMTDGLLNGILDNTSIQSPFGGVDAQFITVESVNYIGAVVPEPGAMMILLVGLCPMIAILRRRRN